MRVQCLNALHPNRITYTLHTFGTTTYRNIRTQYKQHSRNDEGILQVFSFEKYSHPQIFGRGLPYFSIFVYAQCISMYYGNMVSSILYLNIEHIYSHIVEIVRLFLPFNFLGHDVCLYVFPYTSSLRCIAYVQYVGPLLVRRFQNQTGLLLMLLFQIPKRITLTDYYGMRYKFIV